MAPAGPFAARFAEVRIDAALGLLRLARIVSAVDAGRILNEKLERSQIIGATVMGIGMTMLEDRPKRQLHDSGSTLPAVVGASVVVARQRMHHAANFGLTLVVEQKGCWR